MLNSRNLKWLLAVILAFLAISAVITSLLIVERQEALERVSRYNLTWLMSQGANETLRLLETVSASAVPGSGADADDVDLRLNVLANRLSLLKRGEAADFIQSRPDLVETVALLERTLTEITPLIAALPSAEAAAKLRGKIDPLVPRILQMAAASNTRSGELVAADQSELSHLHWTLAQLMFTLIVCAVLLVWMVHVVSARMVRHLQATKDVADAANAAKSQFLANISHELRTPLNGLLGMIELLLMSELPKRQRGFAEAAQNSGRILFEMITEILHFSAIESGKIALDEAPFEIARLTDEVSEILGPQISKKHLDLSVNLAPDLPKWIDADIGRLRQILLNLLGNAVKFTQTGEVELSVTADPPHDGRAMMQFSVRDTGIGIPADRLAHIFDPFTQADLSNTRRFGGVGLGLSIVHNLVQRMGGTIHAESHEGVGSVFRVTLPLRIAAQPAAAPVDTSQYPIGADRDRETTRARTSGPRVLLVDDTRSSRDVARLFLEHAGCGVDMAENGLEAVTKCAMTSYDIVFMDRHMPEMDGIEATRQLRAREAGTDRRLTIIGVSAGAFDEEREVCLAAGMDQYLTKPIRMAQITAAIDDWKTTMTPPEAAAAAAEN